MVFLFGGLFSLATSARYSGDCSPVVLFCAKAALSDVGSAWVSTGASFVSGFSWWGGVGDGEDMV